MIRFRLTLDIGRPDRPPPEQPAPYQEDPEPIPGGTSGNAQVEDAGYGSKPAGWTGTGFSLPEASDPGPAGPY